MVSQGVVKATGPAARNTAKPQKTMAINPPAKHRLEGTRARIPASSARMRPTQL
jgi:hypothetical protein